METWKCLALEVLDEIEAVDAEAERWNLAGAVGDHRAVQVAVLVAEELGLEAAERYAHFQIEFLTSIDRMGFVLVGVFESEHGLVDVGSRDGRVIGTIDALGF